MVTYCDYNLNPYDVRSIASAKLFLGYILGLTLNSGGILHHLLYP